MRTLTCIATMMAALAATGCSARQPTWGIDAVVPALSEPVSRGRVTLHVSFPESATASAVVRTGVPFSRGVLRSGEHVRLRGPGGSDVPFQTRVLTTWDQGQSIRFLLVTFTASPGDGAYTLEYGSQVKAPTSDGLHVIQTDDLVSIESPRGLNVRIRRHSGDIISEVGGLLSQPVQAYFIDQNGNRYESGTHERRVVVEEAGPVSAVVRISGWYTGPDGDHVSQYIVRLYVHANSPRIKLVHTFVNTAHCDDKQYKEIALSVPWAVGDSATTSFELDGESHDVAGGVLVQDWTNVARIVSGDQTFQGKRAGNHVRVSGNAGAMSAAMRWLWQQSPCGFEVKPDGTLKVQFWSPHQERLLDLRPRQYLENLKPGAYETYREQTRAQAHAKYQVLPEDGGELKLSGEGMAKTHELTLDFAGGDARELGLVTEHPPYAYSDPVYACATNVRQPIRHKDPARFPAIEKMLDDFVAGFYAKREWHGALGDMYGYFNFGDTPHNKAQFHHRYWAHQFYCGPSTYWTLYLRSGGRAEREFAEANARHVMELDTGHYTNERTTAGAMIYEDNGVFHHYACEPGMGYTNIAPNTSDIAEYLCLMHQFTGDERARDVIDEVGAAMVQHWERHERKLGWAHRATGYSLKNALEVYQVTGDSTLRELCDYLASQVKENVRDGITTGYDGQTPADFTLSYIFPGAVEYLRVTGDPAMADFIVANARFLAAAGNAGQSDGFNFWDGLTCAYRLTGDRRFIEAAYLAVMEQTRQYDPTGWIGNVWSLYKAPIVMAAAAPLTDLRDHVATFRAMSTAEVALLDRDDAPMSISAVVDGPHRAGDFEKVQAWQAPPMIVLVGPDGRVIDQRRHPAPGYDKWFTRKAWVETFDVPADGKTGVYRVRLLNMPEQAAEDQPLKHDECLIPAAIHVTATGVQGAMGRMIADGLPPGGRYGKGAFYFHVPRDASTVRVAVQTNNVTSAASLTLRDATGAVVAQTPVPRQGLYVNNWFTVEATPTPEQRGTTWSIEVENFGEYYRMRFEGVPPYLARDADAAFVVE